MAASPGEASAAPRAARRTPDHAPGARRRVPFPDPERVARSLSRAGAWCWLDGASPPAVPGADDPVSYLAEADEVRIAERGGEREFLAALREPLRPSAGGSGFTGGWVVACSYEFGVAVAGLEPMHDTAPPAFALRVSTVLAIDHAAGTAELRGESETALDAWLARHGSSLDAAGCPPHPFEAPASAPPVARSTARFRLSEGEYLARIGACREAIARAEATVLCLTDTAVANGVFDPLGVAERLRAGGGALRGAVIVAGGRALVSASPERFLSFRDGRVATHPIKGTRARGRTPSEDAALAVELAADPKERRENRLVGELLAAEFAGFCEPGSVHLDAEGRVESHPRVHQLVRTVSGRLAPGRDVFDALSACLPGGSMTGTPKPRAVEVLARLESGPRGLYSGCFGWIGHGDRAELAVTIRSVELRDDVALVGAGGGITSGSDPARELAEKDVKAAPLLAALASLSPLGARR